MMLESYSSHLCPCAVEVSSSSNTLQSRNVFDAIAVKILVFAEIIGRLQLLKGKVVTALHNRYNVQASAAAHATTW